MVTVLEREMYTETEAARLLGLAAPTLHYWLEGGTQRGRNYPPVIREQPKGTKSVTWAEFIEAALLREYRREHGIPMRELRAFIDDLRQRVGVPYPLADRRPYVGGRKLLLEAQDAAGLKPAFALVAHVGQQLVLTPPSSQFYERVRWDGDIAVSWRPDANVDSPVVVDPEVRFGRPSVNGISTEILAEQFESGATERELCETFSLNLKQVKGALAYELANAAA